MALRRSINSLGTILRHIESNKLAVAPIQKLLFQQNLCKQNFVAAVQTRNFFKDASKTDIPEDGRIRIYYGVLTPQIRAVKWFSLTTSLMGVIAQPFVFKELMAMQNMPLVVAGCTFIGFFTFITPFLLHYITKKYVTHLDYKADTGTYIATTVNFFCMLKETSFKIDDVKVPEVPGMFTTFEVNGNGMFLDPRLFEDPSHYGKIMGYDKPIDFKMYNTTEEDKK